MRLYFKTHESIVVRPRRVSLIRGEYAEQDEEGEESKAKRLKPGSESPIKRAGFGPKVEAENERAKDRKRIN
ncbi:hypothetical protein CCACVL1_05048 [Corchorus capsularis]|uniref:Uncharacterized protein n=1 Tax=Corchorus capsularis TaxID=210143 RepID=A0A1R3JN85_COCAP|nr:hypothetical protein CCACVL1_05048 [Corchorus capsularis]